MGEFRGQIIFLKSPVFLGSRSEHSLMFLTSSDYSFLFTLEVSWEDQQEKVNGTVGDGIPLPRKKQQSEPGLSDSETAASMRGYALRFMLVNLRVLAPRFSHVGVNFIVLEPV